MSYRGLTGKTKARRHRRLCLEQIESRRLLSATPFPGWDLAAEAEGPQTPALGADDVVSSGSLGTLSSLVLAGSGVQPSASLSDFTPVAVPAAPTNLAATVVSPSEINLTWDLGEATETSVVIERKTGAEGSFQTLVTLPPGENIFTDTSGWAATTYTYRVKATNSGGDSAYSGEASAATDAIPTGALVTITDLQAVPASPNAATISFTDPNTADAKRFYLLERSADGVYYQIIKSLGTATSWTDVGRTPNATYFYRVRGVSWNYPSSDYSAAARITMPDRPPGAPLEPSGLEAVAATATSLTLNWTNHDASKPAFKIERAVFNAFHPQPWVSLAITAPGATSYTDIGLKPESTYLYRVSATNSQADSGYAVPSSDVLQSLLGDCIAAITASAGTGSPQVYDIGPGCVYESIAALDWSKLGPGDTVNIHYKPDGYHELFMISTRGTAQAWITVNGVPDPATGALPVIDGLQAVLNPQFKSSYTPLHGSGAILVGTRPGYADGYKPGYVRIQNLQIQRCYAGNNPNTFTDYDGKTKAYTTVGAGIYLYRAEHVTISNCVITDNGEGIFGAGQPSFDRLMSDLTISSNDIFNNGNLGDSHTHNTYLEAVDIVYEFNHYGPVRPGATGNGLKDRSVGVVIRGNYIEGGAHELQLPSAENQDALAVTLPRYRRALVYGNVLVDGPGNVSGPIEYGGENLSAFDRKGTLYLYQNTIVARSDKSVVWRVNGVNLDSTGEALDARNNLFAAIPATPGALHSDFGLLGMTSYALRKANAYFGRNWVPPGYLLNGYGNAGFKGHVAGLANLLVGKTYDPGFLNLAAGDYRLADGSEPTDQAGRLAGTTLAYPADQQYLASGHVAARPVIGVAADLGAFEYGTYPPLTNPGAQWNCVGDTVHVAVVAIGADGFSASGLPPGLSIDNSGQILGTIDLHSAGTYAVVLTATDSGASSRASFTWTVEPPPNQPPADITLSSTVVADRTPGAVIGTLTVTDPNLEDTHTLTVSDARFEITGSQLKLKANASLDQALQPTVALDITATDNGGMSRTETYMISVLKPLVIDDGDRSYLEAGTGWYSIGWWTSGYQTDSRFVSPGDGRKTATWAQTLIPGTYTVQASWSGYHNNVSNAPYRIYDGDGLLAEVRVDQQRNPTRAPGETVGFLTLATVDISKGNLRVVLGNDASGGTLVLADAVRIVPGMLTLPPSVVAGPGVVDDGGAGYVESAYGWYSIGWWTTGYQTDSRFASAGDGRSSATWQQTLAPGKYTVQASWAGYHNNVTNAPYRIYDGDRLLAEVRVDQQRTPSRAPGEVVGFLTLATVDITGGDVRVVLGNDATGGTLVVADAVRIVPGRIASPPSVVAGPGVVDDGESGYTESDYGWYSISWWTTGYQGDSRFVNAGDGRNTAAWGQTLAPGKYTIQASWYGYHNNVSNAPYRIYDGDHLVAEVRVDQRTTPYRAPGDPAPFMSLATVDITSGSVRVVLGNDATGGTLVVADAVRILPIPIAAAPLLVASAPVTNADQTSTGAPESGTSAVSAAPPHRQELGLASAAAETGARGKALGKSSSADKLDAAWLEDARVFFAELGEKLDPWDFF